MDQELLLRNEYLAAENRILRAQTTGRLLLSGSEKATLAEIAYRFGRKALADIASAAKPDTLFRWYRELIAKKFDGSKSRKSLGRPLIDAGIESLLVRMARENPCWGYDGIVGAMANLGHKVSGQTVANILTRHDIPPAPKRKQATSWKDFIRAHMAVMVATDFFTVEVLTLRRLITYYVLFFIHLESRRIYLAGVTRRPDRAWMERMARNVTMEESGFLANQRYLLLDRDGKYCPSFRQLVEAKKVKTLPLPPKSPNLNAYAERWVRSVKEEYLSKLILLAKVLSNGRCITTSSTITRDEIIRGRTTCCFFLRRCDRQNRNSGRFDAENDLVVCSSTTNARRHDAFELFDHRHTRRA